jgi:hypothetical protein
VVDAAVDASSSEHPVKAMTLRTALVQSQHAAGEHPVRGSNSCLVDHDLGVADRVRPETHPQCGDGIRHEGDPASAEGPPREADHRPVDVQAVDDQAGDQRRVGKSRAGRARVAGAHRCHCVEQVGHATKPHSDRCTQLRIGGFGVSGAHGDAVPDQFLDDIEATGQFRREGDHRDPVVPVPTTCLVDGWRSQPMRWVRPGPSPG